MNPAHQMSPPGPEREAVRRGRGPGEQTRLRTLSRGDIHRRLQRCRPTLAMGRPCLVCHKYPTSIERKALHLMGGALAAPMGVG